jgi:hypothetical protein
MAAPLRLTPIPMTSTPADPFTKLLSNDAYGRGSVDSEADLVAADIHHGHSNVVVYNDRLAALATQD